HRMRAHVGQRAVLIDSGSGVVKHPPRRQTQTQPCTAVLHCDTAAGVRRFGVADGVCNCELQRLPKRGNGRMRVAPCALKHIARQPCAI
ncbi:hypothetical protein LOD75_11470, partial [Xylella fastidiosa subsp. multiplex]|uniref:hypothetical protein n=1 Tax=Xylella fastidiosa TaxID=2371 RepID=UPI00235F46FC